MTTTEATPAQVHGGTDLIERAAALRPLLARNAPQCDDDRWVPEGNIAALADAGLFKLTVPRRFGGHEAPLATSLEVTATLAEACGSTAWVVTLTCACSWIVGLYPDRAQQDVFGADPGARVCGVLAPTSQARRVDGGLRVSGTWGSASGCLHSQWAVLGVPPFEADGEQVQQGLALIPMSDLAIEDTWFVAGMRGTGSNTLVAEDVFVPDHRLVHEVVHGLANLRRAGRAPLRYGDSDAGRQRHRRGSTTSLCARVLVAT